MSFVFWLCTGFGVSFLGACLVAVCSRVNGLDDEPSQPPPGWWDR